MGGLRENRIKRKLQRGEIATVIEAPYSADMIDFFGPFGFDGMWLESEHGPVDYADISDLTRACDLWGMTSMIRLSLNLPGVIYRALDRGVQGIIMPHVNTADEARAIVDAVKFAPGGHRGIFMGRQSYGVDDYFAKANDETLIMILIEDIIAINNLTEILKVDHIDIYFVAPGDLSQSMGYMGQMDHPKVQPVVDKAIQQVVDAGKVAGSLVDDSNVEASIKKGLRFLAPDWPEWIIGGSRSFLNTVDTAFRKS